MDSIGVEWFQEGCGWFQQDPSGFKRTSEYSPGLPGTPGDFSGLRRIPRDYWVLRGSPGTSTGICRSSMDSHGLRGPRIDFKGTPLVSAGFIGDSKDSTVHQRLDRVAMFSRNLPGIARGLRLKPLTLPPPSARGKGGGGAHTHTHTHTRYRALQQV